MCLFIAIFVHYIVYLKVFVFKIEGTFEKYTLRRIVLKPVEVIFTTSLNF